jgi:DNA-(apurinic or apyrimidinic site) lyase
MKSKLVGVLGLIPWQKWKQILEEEPEWRFTQSLNRIYPFGHFAVMIVAVGLNDFQLKGKSENVYWPMIRNVLTESETPKTIDQLASSLRPFYERERLRNLKIKRLDRFLSSNLAESLWTAKPHSAAQDFKEIWRELSTVMHQEPQKKTIVFAMKCLGISLLMAKESGFDFSRIPIPVDSRIEVLTTRVGYAEDKSPKGIQTFWSGVLSELKEQTPDLSMIHLDSLCWQIGRLSNAELGAYFKQLELAEVGEKIVELIHANNAH